jgi:hypothetical protein
MANYPELVAADGASHYWRLNDAAGPFAADSIGTADGAIGQVVTFGVPGAVPGDPAMHFDGASGRISVAQQLPFQNSFSVEAWFAGRGARGGHHAAGDHAGGADKGSSG